MEATTATYTYCGFSLEKIVACPERHAAALAAAQGDVHTAETLARIDQCSQEHLDWTRSRLDALVSALEAR